MKDLEPETDDRRSAPGWSGASVGRRGVNIDAHAGSASRKARCTSHEPPKLFRDRRAMSLLSGKMQSWRLGRRHPLTRQEASVSDEVAVNLGEATPRRLLIEWANGQDAWTRELTAETILSRQAPSADLLDRVYETFLAEKGLSDGTQPAVANLEIEAVETSQDDTLELASLSNVQGVNALASNQKLVFDPSLTILFGQNGSGKTGYARILKRISAVRSPEDILPNAHLTYLDTPPPPSAAITFRIGTDEHTTQWNNEAGLTPFTRISVFDANAVSLHVDSEIGYVYTPAELALFKHVANGLQGVQQRIASEVTSLATRSNPLLSKFARETKVYPLIETLGAATDLGELDAAAVVADDAEVTYQRLQTEVNALRANALDALITNAQQSERDLTRLSGVVETIKSFDVERYEHAVAALEAAEKRLAEAREQLFSADELPSRPDEQWQQFVAAGDSYRRHLGRDHYPADGDSCLYCMQPLSPIALSLLTRYRTFLDETLVQQVSRAEGSVAAACLDADEGEMTRAKEFVTDRALEDVAPAWATQAAKLLVKAETVAVETKAGRPVSHTDLSRDATRLAADLEIALGAVASTVRRLTTDRRDAATALATKQKELAELGARLELKKNLHTAREYVRRAKRAQQLEKLSKAISSGASKQLTIQSKLASEDLVNKNFEELFAEECALLNAPKVALTFQGRSGEASARRS